jgi:hypothetical protein
VVVDLALGKALGAMRDRRCAHWRVVVGRNSDGNAARYCLACDAGPERSGGASPPPGSAADGRPSSLTLFAADSDVEREPGCDDDDP